MNELELVWLVVFLMAGCVIGGWLHYWLDRLREREQQERLRRYLNGLPERKQ